MAASTKRYYWLKLKEDFFRDKVMKKMRRIAGGDTYVIIYLKMMLMSIQTDGELYFEGIEDDFAAELSLALDEDEDNIRVAIGFLMRSGKLIEKSKSVYFMPEANEAIGSESSSAERVRKHREKKRMALSNTDNPEMLLENIAGCEMLHCNESETLCNVTSNVEKSREEESRERGDESIAEPPDKPAGSNSQKQKRFVKPTLEEIKAYCLSRQNNVDAERFYDYYESNGWRVGKSPMKDWKAAVRTWERNEWNIGGARNGTSGDIPAACYDGTI